MTCHDARERFSDWVDEALSPEDRALVAGHLETCADCRRELDRFTRHRIPAASDGAAARPRGIRRPRAGDGAAGALARPPGAHGVRPPSREAARRGRRAPARGRARGLRLPADPGAPAGGPRRESSRPCRAVGGPVAGTPVAPRRRAKTSRRSPPARAAANPRGAAQPAKTQGADAPDAKPVEPERPAPAHEAPTPRRKHARRGSRTRPPVQLAEKKDAPGRRRQAHRVRFARPASTTEDQPRGPRPIGRAATSSAPPGEPRRLAVRRHPRLPRLPRRPRRTPRPEPSGAGGIAGAARRDRAQSPGAQGRRERPRPVAARPAAPAAPALSDQARPDAPKQAPAEADRLRLTAKRRLAPSDVVGRLAVKDRDAAERSLVDLLARSGGTLIARREETGSTVLDVVVPHGASQCSPRNWRVSAPGHPRPPRRRRCRRRRGRAPRAAPWSTSRSASSSSRARAAARELPAALPV